VITNGTIGVERRPDPEPGDGEVLVRTEGAGINAADLLQRAGLYPPPPGAPADVPGMEVAGTVVATGPGAERFAEGDRVMAVVGGGAQAELVVVHERVAMPVPETLEAVPAGAVPEAFTTAHDALFTQCELGLGERVLITGAAGGVGTAGVQLAVAAGASVVATVRNEALRASVSALGATAVDPADVHHHGPYDVVLELVGGPNVAQDLDLLAIGGRIAVIGLAAGSRADIDLRTLMGRRARLHGSTLRARPLEGKADAARRFERHVLPLLAAGRLTVPIAATFPLEEVEAAYERFAAGGKFGKIVLVP
jgi:NADPH2:quinone reductase